MTFVKRAWNIYRAANITCVNAIRENTSDRHAVNLADAVNTVNSDSGDIDMNTIAAVAVTIKASGSKLEYGTWERGAILRISDVGSRFLVDKVDSTPQLLGDRTVQLKAGTLCGRLCSVPAFSR